VPESVDKVKAITVVRAWRKPTAPLRTNEYALSRRADGFFSQFWCTLCSYSTDDPNVNHFIQFDYFISFYLLASRVNINERDNKNS